jgi:hypothetical protein
MRTANSLLLAAALAAPLPLAAAAATILGWNNLGMHCMDSDYSVFSILPPYNTIEAQLIVNGRLVTNGVGYTLTYQAMADPDGSFNSTAMGKGDFYQFVQALYGATLGPEAGLAGWAMPGTNNVPQPMLFEPTNHPAAGVATRVNWFRAEGIPIAPYDDALRKNPYPMMRVVARNAASQPIATNGVVLPVSDEMDCRACHASGTQAPAQPGAGWVWSGLPERDYRLNILRLHDERQWSSHSNLYAAALSARGFNPLGLYRGVTADGKPALCAICHASEALGTGSYSNIPPLTASVHAYHAGVADPVSGVTLDDSANRAACYRCHPGSTTKCLRGAMGGAVAADGSMAMQCQGCHGNMSTVGSSSRVGWFMEPVCQSCHTGTAAHNNGQIRYTSAFESNGQPRVAADTTFATQPNTPATGLSLYRFSAGHGGLQCEACHGSTHAEFPSTHHSDNLRNLELQGHAGVMVECTACHAGMPNTVSGGPHGMHPLGSSWINSHPDLVEGSGAASCQACHGTDYRGTVLSRAHSDRSFTVGFDGGSVTLNLFRGAVVSCYACHNGPGGGDANPGVPPQAGDVSMNTLSGSPVAMTLPISGTGAAARLIAQPAHGSVGLNGAVATYFPEPGYVGTDTFKFSAWDGSKNSGLATGTISVGQGPFALAAVAHVPPTYPAAWPVPFAVVATPSNITATVSHDWDFGDGSAHGVEAQAAHAYALPGTYHWAVISKVQGAGSSATATNSGDVVIGSPVLLTATTGAGATTISWPLTIADSLLEQTGAIGPLASWSATVDPARLNGTTISVTQTNPVGNEFFRLRRPW